MNDRVRYTGEDVECGGHSSGGTPSPKRYSERARRKRVAGLLLLSDLALVLMGFLAGCVVGGVTYHLLLPTPSAHPAQALTVDREATVQGIQEISVRQVSHLTSKLTDAMQTAASHRARLDTCQKALKETCPAAANCIAVRDVTHELQ